MSMDNAATPSELRDLVALLEWADPRALWDVWPDVARRPEEPPGRVVAGLLPWDERERQRAFALQVELASASATRHVMWWLCSFWGIGEVGECAAACASELVANAIVHATWSKTAKERVHLIVSLSALSLLVEVCDPDPRWPRPEAGVDWDAVDWSAPGKVGESGFGLGIVRTRVAELGGEFGCVSGLRSKSVFFALPVPDRAEYVVSDWRQGGSQ